MASPSGGGGGGAGAGAAAGGGGLQAAAAAMHRVKVYRLNNEGSWLDKGTGFISLQYMEARRGRGAAAAGGARARAGPLSL